MKKRPVKLGVNIDHVATLRQQRKGFFPDTVEAALAAQKAGADGITVHLREDRRHIQDSDVLRLKKCLRIRLNLEMACSRPVVDFAVRVKPSDACLVPEKRKELTTEGGLDVIGQKIKVENVVARLKKAGIRVSIFVDPDLKQIGAAKEIGADAVELHTGCYADAKSSAARKREFKKLVRASEHAKSLGLILNAGHGLDYHNTVPVAKIPGMNELNIGFSIVGRALFTGLETAVRDMKKLITG